MVDPRLYEEDVFVFLDPTQSEPEYLSPGELLARLKGLIQKQETLPPDLQHLPSLEKQAQALLTTYCKFEVSPGCACQWYAVRLKK